MIGCSFGSLQLGIARKKDQFRQKREEERRDVATTAKNNPKRREEKHISKTWCVSVQTNTSKNERDKHVCIWLNQ